jgi:hypothetical protein
MRHQSSPPIDGEIVNQHFLFMHRGIDAGLVAIRFIELVEVSCYSMYTQPLPEGSTYSHLPSP